MKKKLTRLLTIVTLLGIAFSATAWVVSFVRAQASQQPSQNVSGTKRKKLRDVAQERAVEKAVSESEGDNESDDLRSLTKTAHAIVLGRILEEKSAFSGDDHISTTYMVDVQRVLKEPKLDLPPDYVDPYYGKIVAAPLTTPLSVVRSGGEVTVNGHRASVKLKGSELLTAGKTYIFFLGWITPTSYHINSGASGAFLVDDNLRVKALGSEKGIKKHDGMDVETFINEIALNNQ